MSTPRIIDQSTHCGECNAVPAPGTARIIKGDDWCGVERCGTECCSYYKNHIVDKMCIACRNQDGTAALGVDEYGDYPCPVCRGTGKWNEGPDTITATVPT